MKLDELRPRDLMEQNGTKWNKYEPEFVEGVFSCRSVYTFHDVSPFSLLLNITPGAAVVTPSRLTGERKSTDIYLYSNKYKLCSNDPTDVLLNC